MSHLKIQIFFISAFICLFLFIPSGCALLVNRVQAPTVHIAEVKLKELKPLEATFSVQLHVINPNNFSFIVKGANFDFSINGVHLATGVSDKATEIPVSGTTLFTVDIYSSVLDVLKGAQSISSKNKSKYKIKGRLNIDAGRFLPSTFPFESDGDLDIKDLLSRH